MVVPGNPAGMGRGLLKVIAAPHPFDASLGIDDPLFARVEGVAIAAHLNAERRLGGPGVEYVATGAGHRGVIKMGVNICFHFLPVYLSGVSVEPAEPNQAASTGYTLTRRRPLAAHSNFTSPSMTAKIV